MTMTKIPIQTTRFPGGVRVCIEASFKVISECNLDTMEGEHFDYIDNCIVMDVNPVEGTVRFESTRSIEAYRRGEPNAGRGVWTFKRDQLEAVYVP